MSVQRSAKEVVRESLERNSELFFSPDRDHRRHPAVVPLVDLQAQQPSPGTVNAIKVKSDQ